MRLSLRFVFPLALVLGLLVWAVVPFIESFTTRWAVSDLDLRAKLIASTIDNRLFEVIDNDNTRTKKNVQSFFDRIMQNERLFALGFCDDKRILLYQTDRFPGTISCSQIAPAIERRPSEIISLPKGLVHVAYFPMQGSGRLLGELVLVHDMSFVQNRSDTTKNYIVLFLLGIGAIVSVITVAVAQLSWRGWVAGMRGILHGEGLLRPMAPTAAPPELQPIVRDLQSLIRDLDTDRRLRDDIQTAWTPRVLKELLQKELAGDEVIVVSNREPYIHTHTENGIQVSTPASGLVTAMEPIMRACSGTWIAHGSGDADEEVVDRHDRIAVPPEHPSYSLRRVWLTKEEEDGYYYGFANEGLWPLCHIAHVRPVFRTEDWEQYKNVNKKFADAVVKEAKTDDPVILIQDYHFALLPQMLRKALPNATIVSFWHIPWPNPEAFGICPWTNELLEGLLGSSIVGFHTRYHCNNFVDTVERFLECKIDREHWTVSHGGELTGVQRYPISIEFPGPHLRHAHSVEDARIEVREQYGIAKNCKLGIGVDRFDYTKGIIEKFAAIKRLFELYPEWIGRVSFLQIAAPTRSKIEEYRRFTKEAIEYADRINELYGRAGYKPIILSVEHCKPADIVELYRAADFCFVGSLHDGMNLVSKEFVAARDDEHGVLILSQFTGAARDFPEALIVNPYHADQCAEALNEALTMPSTEQRDRLRNMRGILHDFNVYRWAGRMLLDAARMRQRKSFIRRVSKIDEEPFTSEA